MAWRFEHGGPEPHAAPAPSPYDAEREGGNLTAALTLIGGLTVWAVLLRYGIPAICHAIQAGGRIVGGFL